MAHAELNFRMDGDKTETATASSLSRSGSQHKQTTRKDEGDVEHKIMAPPPERRSAEDVERQNELEPHISNATPASASEKMSFSHEELFVATVILTQLCNRECPQGHYIFEEPMLTPVPHATVAASSTMLILLEPWSPLGRAWRPKTTGS